MMTYKTFLILPFIMLGLAGCQQDESSGQPQDAVTQTLDIASVSQGFTVSGVASKGPIQNATVEFFTLDATGQPIDGGYPSTTTDANGQWQASISVAPTVPLLIRVSGGEYIDEADPAENKRSISLSASEFLEGVLWPGFDTASVTLLTHALVEKSRNETTANNFQDVLSNNRNSARQAIGFDPFTTAAANPLAPAASASEDAIEYAMMLGGMAYTVNSAAIIMSQPLADYPVLRGFIDDLSDGVLNGQKFGAAIQLDINGVSTNFPDNLDLNLAIARFRNNNFSAYSVTPVSEIVQVNETVLAVPGTNANPTAVDDEAATISDVAINLTTLTANDSDPDGDQLTISSFTQPVNGSVEQQADGSLTFAPTSGFIGNTVFSYTVTDNRGGEDNAQVVISIAQAPVNGSGIDPTANAGADQDVDEQTTVTLDGTASLDSDGSISSYAWSQVDNSGVTVSMTGANTAQPTFTAPTTSNLLTLVFTLTVTDNDGQTDDDSVSIIVHPVNIPPQADAGPNQPSASEESVITLDGSGSSDSDGTIASYSWTQVDGVPVTLANADQASATFTSPTVLINNLETLFFQLTVTDNNGDSDSDFISVTVNPVLSAPVANAGPDQTVNESDGSAPVIVTLDGSASSDERSIASYSWTQIAGSPTLTLSDNSVANPTFTAPDVANDTVFTFQLTVTDDEGGVNTNTDTNTVDITIVSLNTGPIPVDDSAITDEDVALQITTLMDNDSDAEGNTFSINSVTQPANGSVVIDAGNTSVTYTPSANFNGSDSFTYTLIDEFGAISTTSGTVTVTINGTNDDPVAVADSASVVQGFPVTLSNLLANDTDLEGDTLALSGISQPANGVAVNNGDGTVTYTPELSFNGTDSFTYNIVDGNGGSATGTVTITVIADTDGDGIIDSDELVDGTDPTLWDTDGDGFSDKHEKLVGTNAIDGINDSPTTTEISAANNNNVIASDTTWSLANAPYWLQDDVTIQTGATLTIEPGVVVKSNANVDILVNSGGALNAAGNAAIPQHVIFTSSQDDSINGDTNGNGGATQPSNNNWQGIDFRSGSINGLLRNATVRYAVDCINIDRSSPVLQGLEIGDCGSYGIYMYVSSSTHSANLSDITFKDFDGNLISTINSSVRIISATAGTINLNIDNLNIADTGNSSTNDHGVEISSSGGILNGSIDRVTVTNPSSDGINILNGSGAAVTIALSNLSVDGAGLNALDIRNTSIGTLTTTFDGVNSFTNSGTTSTASAIYVEKNDPDFLDTGSVTIDSVQYGLQLNNSAGSFRNFAISNITTSGLRLENASDPAVFTNIVLTNAVAPYELLGQNLTPTITAGYDFSDASVTKTNIRVFGTLSADMTLTADPLATGDSVWFIPSNLIVSNGLVLSVDDGAILKFALNTRLDVYGTLNIGDGVVGGNRAVLTSFRDDTVGAAISDGTAPARTDWYDIYLRDNSVINIDNAVVRYAQRALYQYYRRPTSVDITNTLVSDIYYYGFDIEAGSGDFTIWNLDNIDFDRVGVNTNYHGIYAYINTDATLGGSWSNLTFNNIGGTAILIDDNSTGVVNPIISGLTIGDTGTIGVHGVDLQGDATTQVTIDGSSGSGNSMNGGNYNLLLRGVGGTYSNMTLSNALNASIYLSGGVDPVGGWDDATIFLNSAPSPYRVLTDFPANIGVFGTADLGYNATSTVTQDYVSTGGSLSNTTYVADPLNTGNSLYYVVSNISVPALTTLNIDDGAILKFALNTRLDVYGTLNIGDGVVGGNRAVLTSFRDDSIGAAISDGTAPARTDRIDIYVRDNSVINIDNADIRYAQRGLYQPNTRPTSVDISNTLVSDIYYYGFEVDANSGDVISWTLNNVDFNRVGFNTNYHGIYAYINNDATLDGSWSNLTFNNIGGTAILIDDNSTGVVNPVISGLTIGDTGTIGVHGVDLQGDATTQVTIDNSSGSANTIAGGNYNLLLRGVAGSYSNITLDGATTAAIYFSADAAPSVWSSITINNAPTPYHVVGMNIPAGVSYASTIGLGESYVRFTGPINADLTLTADPLGTASGTGKATDPTVSYWYMPSTLQINTSLTIEQDTLVKFDEASYLQVNAGAVLNVNGVAGGEVYFTSFSDDVVGDAASSAALINDWYGIYFKTNSNGGTLSHIQNWYAYYGVLLESVSVDPSFNDLSINYSLYGIYMNSSVASAPQFTNVDIFQSDNQGLFLTGAGLINPGFAGTKRISSSIADDCIYNSSSSPNILISGWTLENCSNGIEVRQAGTYIDNLIRNSSSSGIYIQTSSALTVGNNRIVNNGTYGSTSGGGIRIASIGATSLIENNLIRHNQGSSGGGIYLDGGTIDTTIRNNLIIENTASISGGGVYIYDNSTVQLSNNTIAGNRVSGINNSGAGLFIQDFTNNVTYDNNIIADNRDDDSLENLNDLSTGSVENFNLEDGSSTNGLTGAGSLVSTDPAFTEGWYLSAGSLAIDAGSDLPANLGLTGTTTQTDGTLDGLAGGASDTVDMGYHYTAGSTVVSAANSIVTPVSQALTLGETITISITPQDASSAIIGSGLDVQVTAATFPASVGRLIDAGDGIYTFTYTAGNATSSDTLTIVVNGVTLDTTVSLNW